MAIHTKITSFKIDIFTNGDEVYMLDDVLYNFECRFIENKDENYIPNEILLIFSRHFDLPNIIDLLNKYKRIVIFEMHEYIDEIRMKNTIIPILKEYRGSKTVISHMPNYHSLIEEWFGDNTFYPFSIESQISIWRSKHYKGLEYNENRNKTIKTYIGKRKWDRDLVYLLQKNYCSNDLSILKYTYNNCGEPDEHHKSKVQSYINTLNVNNDFNYDIINDSWTIDAGFNQVQCKVDTLDFKYYVIVETQNPDLSIDEYKRFDMIPRYTLTEKSIVPLAMGNIFYDFSFKYPSTKFLKEIGFETFFDDNSLAGLKDFYEMINKYPDDMYNDSVVKAKLKHNFDLIKPIVAVDDFEMPLYLKHIIDFVNNT